MMKPSTALGMAVMQKAAQFLAMLFCASLLIAAGLEIFQVYQQLFNFDITQTIRSGLFTLIILEMVFVTRSFIKYGSVNTALILSVGVVAVVKALIFNIDTLTLEQSISFSLLILALAIGYVLETYTYQIKVSQGRKQRSIKKKIQDDFQEGYEVDFVPSELEKET